MSEKKCESVKVVVRCRPLNSKETEDGRKVIVDVDDKANEVRLKNPEAPNEPVKSFPFDVVFPPGTAQSKVFDLCAKDIVQAVIDGFNGTIFAYGQTGTGKTFSMTGVLSEPELRGITPRAFAQIFEFIAQTPNCQFLVRASYLEIYNEQIRDLLGEDPKAKLELKQHPQYGVFVKDLTAIVVKDEKEMDALQERGNSNRAVASTKMNAGSSRSHAIFTVVVEANEKDAAGQDHIKQGKMNLVDLAGSERAGKTEATGDRLKEGCAINLSLVALGNVINALVEGKAKHIPYRDSKLTRLLEDSLGGSAKTAMVTNIGPADWNYEETLSTLRYASRAKNIKNKPKINEDPKDALLREMQEEIAKLKAELAGIGGEGQVALQEVQAQAVAAGIDPAVIEQLKQETDEKIRSVLKDKGMLEEERNKFIQALTNLKQKEAQEKELREAVEMQLRMLEGNICVGGVNLFDENQQIQSKLNKQAAELKAAEADRLRLQKQLESTKEEDFGMEEKYSSLQEEVVGRKEKLKKLNSRYEYYRSENESLRKEWEREKEDLLQTVRDLSRDLKKKQAIVDFFVPDQMQQLIFEQMSKWDADSNDWSIRSCCLAGNLTCNDDDDDDQPEQSRGGHHGRMGSDMDAESNALLKKRSVFTSKNHPEMQVYLSYNSAAALAKTKAAAPLVTTAALIRPQPNKKPITCALSPGLSSGSSSPGMQSPVNRRLSASSSSTSPNS